MFSSIKRAVYFFSLLWTFQLVVAQTEDLHGQASGWVSANHDSSYGSQGGVRYIPDLLVEKRISDQFDANMELSVNAFSTFHYEKNGTPSYDEELKPYRGWVRLSTDKFELRAGLQKINFGSASIFRPLMWFDRVDPRDPLQLTDGVYAVLARYTFLNNANVWLWDLYGNDKTKGWELAPTEKRTSEYGGRAQLPLGTGEVAATYDHRRADLSGLIPLPIDTISFIAPEDRLGLDGKWDVGIGLWFEGALTRQENSLLQNKYERLWTVGADYTFAVGNGLYAETEYFRSDTPNEPFTSSEGIGFSALSLSYPIGIVDQASAMIYHDWKNDQWYRLLTWQRTYDNWSFYLIGFWNPDVIRIYSGQTGENPFTGTGLQIMAVFNH